MPGSTISHGLENDSFAVSLTHLGLSGGHRKITCGWRKARRGLGYELASKISLSLGWWRALKEKEAFQRWFTEAHRNKERGLLEAKMNLFHQSCRPEAMLVTGTCSVGNL